VTCSAGAFERVKRLQKPHRISQNGMCTYRKRESVGSSRQTSASAGRGRNGRYAVLCG
jgi:hypothetical protein